ncbi:MAG: helix-turn-helix transcriptional regulator [Ruminococcus sp.]|nr:helix-turn-helix transcriptional regulator [Ruminococcus sp.]
MAFSENVRQAHEREGLSQEEFAERIGVTQQMVSKYESGTKVLAVSTKLTDCLIEIQTTQTERRIKNYVI